MARAAQACKSAGCPHLQPCPDHPDVPWSTKQGRGNRMKSGSREQKINRMVMELHDGCCHVCSGYGADQVDHVIPLEEGGADDMDNRRPIHSEPCHRLKSQAEAARGRERAR